jgi:hypothetical protein
MFRPNLYALALFENTLQIIARLAAGARANCNVIYRTDY